MNTSDIFVFDLDGVITDPSDSSVDPAVMSRIHALLEEGHVIAVNSGRSYVWVKEHFVDALEHLGATAFDRLYVVCEKGGESIIWNGGEFVPQPSRFALDVASRDECRRIFEEGAAEFGSMFWDGTKQTMATIEKRPEAELSQFKREQAVLAERLRAAFPGNDIRIDATTIATDVESAEAGKHAGAELIHAWVQEHHPAEGARFISFGDSLSDYEMARYFDQAGSASTFVFVGKKDTVFDEAAGVELVRTRGEYAGGTREYLSGGE